MLDEKRIKEAETNIRTYLEEGLIRKINPLRDEILETYKRNHKESLKVAQKIFDQELSNLWVVVISYYSMYYAANAVLYNIG